MNIRKLNEELDRLLNEDSRKLTKKDIIDIYNKNGSYYYDLDNKERTIARIDKDFIPEMPEKFERDLNATDTYGYYYPVPKEAVEQNKVMTYLPIYGDANHYVTKWLKPTIQKAIEMDIRDIGIDDFSLASKNYEILGIDNSENISHESKKEHIKEYQYVVSKIYRLDYWKDDKAGDKGFSAYGDDIMDVNNTAVNYSIELCPSNEYEFIVNVHCSEEFEPYRKFDFTQTFGENGEFKIPDDYENNQEFIKEVRKAFRNKISQFYVD